MAPYAVAHFKLGLALAAWDKEPLFRPQWSYEPRQNERVNIFLTNTLEDLEKTAEQLGPLRILSDEANSAYEIKKHKPVLVILGNPPYSGHSANKGEWIRGLIDDYKTVDGRPLGERNPKWLQDDYVKFIRWAQWRIEQTGQGILGFITNHGYLDNPTFRGMRQSLMRTFDEIYLLDLHGNAKKKEIDPATGQPDKNVFDIQQGVAIGIFVKSPKSAVAATVSAAKGKGLLRTADATARVFHANLYSAKRDVKYKWLDGHTIENTKWTKLEPASPNYLFIPRDEERQSEYDRGWKITDAMLVSSAGIVTARDSLSICFGRRELEQRVHRFATIAPERARQEFRLGPDTRDWAVELAQRDLKESDLDSRNFKQILYRPFDLRWTYFTGTTRGFHCMPRPEVMRHMICDKNVALIVTRQTRDAWTPLAAKKLVAHKAVAAYDINSVFPLYLYPNGKLPDDDLFVREEAEEEKRRPNFSAEFIKDLCARLEVKFVRDGLGKPSKRQVGPELVFNYIYAVFHSAGYRERYAEFLRTDFPRVPLTRDYALFQQLAGFGGHLVDLHARENGNGNTSFPINGSNVIEEVRYEEPRRTGDDRHEGRVWINDKQYFDNVPKLAWEFPIGGYLPARRWLKDRIKRTLSFSDKATYPRIIFALVETNRLMTEIEKVIHKHGGWPAAFT
jgi:predicted helicase